MAQELVLIQWKEKQYKFNLGNQRFRVIGYDICTMMVKVQAYKRSPIYEKLHDSLSFWPSEVYVNKVQELIDQLSEESDAFLHYPMYEMWVPENWFEYNDIQLESLEV